MAIFEDDDLSQAIGSNGSNIKLTSKVTGYQIDAVGISEYEKNQKVDLSEIKSITSKYRKILSDNDILTSKDFLSKEKEELIELKGLGEKSISSLTEKIKEALQTI